MSLQILSDTTRMHLLGGGGNSTTVAPSMVISWVMASHCPLSASKLNHKPRSRQSEYICSVFDLAGLGTEPAMSARHNLATTVTQPYSATPLVVFSVTCLIASLALF